MLLREKGELETALRDGGSRKAGLANRGSEKKEGGRGRVTV
jgi:hypothetical protein